MESGRKGAEWRIPAAPRCLLFCLLAVFLLMTGCASHTPPDKGIPVTGISLEPTSLSLTVGEIATISATITPENADDRSVTWRSFRPDVAAVTNGVVTAVREGTAQIVATASSGKTAICTVTVLKQA